MDQWSGGVADTQNDQLLIWGGGHGNGFDNGLYALHMGTSAAASSMTALTKSSCPTNAAQQCQAHCETLPDGNPNARQTYDALVYVPSPKNALLTMGGGPASTDGGFTARIWEFDLAQSVWKDTGKTSISAGGQGEFATGYLPATGLIYTFNGNLGFGTYDPMTGTVQDVGANNGIGDYHQTSIVDPVHKVWWFVGNGLFEYIDLSGSPTYQVITASGAGCAKAIAEAYPGVAYDSAQGQVVIWPNHGSSVFRVTFAGAMSTCTEEMHTENGVVPTDPDANSQGTYKRFGYFPNRGVFGLCTGVDANCFALRSK
jgi:hypothetical protein